MSRGRLVIAVVALLILLAASACGGGNGATSTKANVATAACAAARVHYRPYAGMQKGLTPLPWISASAQAKFVGRLVGHLFYYPAQKVWQRKRLARFRIYSGGQSPDGRFSMKILWQLRSGGASGPSLLRIRGKRLDGNGSFSQIAEGANQFPSIIDVPAPGCWRLTLRTGNTTGRVTVIALSRK